MNFNYSRFIAGSIVFGAALAIFVISPSVTNSSLSDPNSTPTMWGVSVEPGELSLGAISFGLNTALAVHGWPHLPPDCPPPTCWLRLGVSTAHQGDNVTLYWSSTNATSGYLHTY